MKTLKKQNLMKIAVMALCLLFILPETIFANSRAERRAEREINNQVNERTRELQREGWRVHGGLTMQAALRNHIQQLHEGFQELTGDAMRSQTVSAGLSAAELDARHRHALEINANVLGAVEDATRLNQVTGATAQGVQTSFAYAVQAEMGNLTRINVRLYRPLENNMVQVRVFAIVDADQRNQAIIRAMELVRLQNQADLANAQFMQEWGEIIRNHVEGAHGRR